MALKSKQKLWRWCGLLAVISLFFFVFGCSSKVKKQATDISQYIKHSEYDKENRGTTKKTSVAKKKKRAYKNSPKAYQVFGKWYYPLEHARGFRQRGIASWYGEDFHGRPTSNGETFNMNEISAAHKILPLGTYVKVYNLENGRTLTLRVNDRGPFIPGRIIDLSKAAAKALGVFGPGTAQVEIVALGTPTKPSAKNGYQSYIPSNYYKGNFSIQVGAFRDRSNAEKLRRQLNQAYKNAQVRPYYNHRGGELLYRVLVGRCSDLTQAEQYENILKRKGFSDAFAVAD